MDLLGAAGLRRRAMDGRGPVPDAGGRDAVMAGRPDWVVLQLGPLLVETPSLRAQLYGTFGDHDEGGRVPDAGECVQPR